MLQDPNPALRDDPAKQSLPAGLNLVMAAMVLAILYLGVYPTPFIETLQRLAGAF